MIDYSAYGWITRVASQISEGAVHIPGTRDYRVDGRLLDELAWAIGACKDATSKEELVRSDR